MPETIDQMRARHGKEIHELQEHCTHSYISKWTAWAWAPGHISGQVKVCELCGKIIKRRKGLPKGFDDAPEWKAILEGATVEDTIEKAKEAAKSSKEV